MIVGVGTDMVEIGRMEKACGRPSFLDRVFTEEERRQAGGKISRLAGDFAVKEAVSKVLGTGFRGFWPSDVEVLRDELGKPYVCLYGGALGKPWVRLLGPAQRLARERGIDRIHVSITNTEVYALAFAVGEGEQV